MDMKTDAAITGSEYKRLQDFIYEKLGIEVDDKKKETVTTKINNNIFSIFLIETSI